MTGPQPVAAPSLAEELRRLEEIVRQLEREDGDLDRARRVALRLRTGNVHLNGAGPDFTAPFGGYKQSGNGREWGKYGLEEYLEVKAVAGYNAA